MEKIKEFAYICKLTQKELKKYVSKELSKTHKKIINNDGFIFAKGSFPVLLVAHLDTVHSKIPSKIYYDKEQDHLYCHEGIGGDDRCGVFMILEIIKEYNCSVLFCEDEEIGTIGATKFVKSNASKELTDINYIIELDRRGNNDAVFYNCDNKEFEKFITSNHYKTEEGSYSDISIIAPHLKIAAVNLSCGYYNAHTKNEFVKIREMNENIKKVCEILQKTKKEDKYEYIEKEFIFKTNKNTSRYQYSFYDQYYMFIYADENTGEEEYEEIFANSDEEAVGTFCMQHPTIPFANVCMYID